MLKLLLALFLLLNIPSLSNAQWRDPCWCDPRVPGFLGQCYVSWKVFANQGGPVCWSATDPSPFFVYSGPPVAHRESYDSSGQQIWPVNNLTPCPELALALSGAEGLYYPGGHRTGPEWWTSPNPGEHQSYERVGTSVPMEFTLQSAGVACFPLPEWMQPPIAIWPQDISNTEKKRNLAKSVNHAAQWAAEFFRRRAMEIPGSPQWRGANAVLASAMANLAKVVQAWSDPPNAYYVEIPALITFGSLPLLTADGDMTAEQATAINTWTNKMRKVNERVDWFNRTLDSASGAILAAQGGDTAAIPWVRRHAREIDAIGKKIEKKGIKEINARAAVVSTTPPVPVPQYCITPQDLASLANDMFAIGADADSTYKMQRYVLGFITGSTLACNPAGVYPQSFIANNADHLAAYAVFGDPGYAETVCVESGFLWCSNKTLTTITSNTPQPGMLSQMITTTVIVPPAGHPYYPAMTNTIVNVSIVDVAGVVAPVNTTLSMSSGSAQLLVPLPAGSYTVTATFPPDQKSGKLWTSVGIATVVVQ